MKLVLELLFANFRQKKSFFSKFLVKNAYCVNYYSGGIDRVELSSAQKDCKTDYLSKGARFDVYVKDGTGRCFDIEIQTSHLKDLPKRARYYQGVMDVDNLMAGDDYKNLKDSYVIFLCMGDPFGLGLPVYTIRNRIDEVPSELIDDGRLSVFYNAKLYAKMKSQKLQAFFGYLSRQKSDSDLTDRLIELVERLKISPQERKVKEKKPLKLRKTFLKIK